MLDNADGQLARLTGRVTVLGRYLDSESDLVVDAALFAAIGWATGRWVLAAAGFACLTLVLGVNYNVERLYRREHGEPSEAMPAATGPARRPRPFLRRSCTRRRTGWSSGFVEWRLRGAARRRGSPSTTVPPSRCSPTSA